MPSLTIVAALVKSSRCNFVFLGLRMLPLGGIESTLCIDFSEAVEGGTWIPFLVGWATRVVGRKDEQRRAITEIRSERKGAAFFDII